MSEEMIVRHCSPTLAGIKTGSLFTCPFTDAREVLDGIRALNKRLGIKGLRLLPLHVGRGRALIYVYRPKRLSRDLGRSAAAQLLRERGYRESTPTGCILQLMRRLEESGEFPHEIGLFLGYPPEDVCGFIEHRACGCKCVGCWKVYGDAEAARKLFAKYKKCTQLYCAQLKMGRSIERLTVTV